MPTVKISGRCIGDNQPVFIVAEISANHNQKIDAARDLIKAAADAGANAVKFQTYTPDSLTINSDQSWFKIKNGLWAGKTLYDLYNDAFMPWTWHAELFNLAENLGLIAFSTPFSNDAVHYLEMMHTPAYKIASFEIVDPELLKSVAFRKKPVILSTGMASWPEIRNALKVLKDNGANEICLLKCTSSYPAPLNEMNLATIPHMQQTFDVVVGISDHTLGSIAAVTAIALGAKIVEKHITLDRSGPGPDSKFSTNPDEFSAMVQAIRQTESALGEISYDPTPSEEDNFIFRRSLFVVEDMKAGDAFTSENVKSIRPGYGLPPRALDIILGKKANADIPRGTPLHHNLVAYNE